MKKLFLAIAAIALFCTVSFAQDSTKKVRTVPKVPVQKPTTVTKSTSAKTVGHPKDTTTKPVSAKK